MRRLYDLTDDDAKAIRRRWSRRPTIKSLAAEYKCTTSVIQNILSGQQYRPKNQSKERVKFNIENHSLNGHGRDECTTAP